MSNTTNPIDYSDADAVADALTQLEETNPESTAPVEKPEAIEDETTELETEELEAESDSDPEDDLDDDEESDEEDEAELDSEDDDDEDLLEPEDDVVVSDDAEVEVDGEYRTIAELKAGYLRQSNFTKEKQELAQQREQLQQFEQEAASYLTQNLTQYQKMLEEARKIDMAKLAETDPRKYARVRANIDQIEQRMKDEQAKLQEWHKRYLDNQAAEKQKATEAAMPIIMERIPNFDTNRAVEILKYATKLGMDEAEARQITDPYVIVALDKAMRYDAAKSKAVEKRRATKSSNKAISKKSKADTAYVESKQRSDIRSKLKQTSDPEVLADLLTQLQINDR